MRYATANNISTMVLKVLAERKTVSYDDLRRITELLPDELQVGLQELSSNGYVKSTEPNKYSLTDLGERAGYFVS